MVGAAAPGFSRTLLLHCLFNLGRVSRGALSVRSVSLAFLLSRIGPTGVDAGLGYGGSPDPLGAGWIPGHVLLLSRRVLQSILGGPSFLHGRRAAQEISRRALVSS